MGERRSVSLFFLVADLFSGFFGAEVALCHCTMEHFAVFGNA
jgi:hypothetical protein